MNAALLSSKKMDWCTPIDFFNELNKEFNFVLDAAATDETAKCKDYFTPETDGLKQSWKRTDEESTKHDTTIVLLIPARTDTTYFHNYIYKRAEIRFIRGRLKFTDENGIAGDAAPFPSMIVIYNGRC